VLITDSTFVSISRSYRELFSNNCPQITAENYIVNKFFVNSGEAQMKIAVPQKPNSSPLFTGQKDVLDKLEKIFVNRTSNRPRRSCLLWLEWEGSERPRSVLNSPKKCLTGNV
jgi:hypothetical protein